MLLHTHFCGANNAFVLSCFLCLFTHITYNKILCMCKCCVVFGLGLTELAEPRRETQERGRPSTTRNPASAATELPLWSPQRWAGSLATCLTGWTLCCKQTEQEELKCYFFHFYHVLFLLFLQFLPNFFVLFVILISLCVAWKWTITVFHCALLKNYNNDASWTLHANQGSVLLLLQIQIW